MIETNFQRIFKVGVGDFRRKNSVGVAVSFTDQSIKVSADKLNVENSVPSNVIFGFILATGLSSAGYQEIEIGF